MSVHLSTRESELSESSTCSEQQRQLTDSVDSLLLQNSFRAAVRRTCYRCRCSTYRLRRVKSKGAILVLAISFLIFTTFNSVDTLLFSKLQFNVHFFPSLAHMIEYAIFIFFCPLFGWLADVYFGRYKVMCAGLWMAWCGSCGAVLTLVFQNAFPEAESILNYTALLPFSVISIIGYSGFIVSAVPFGTDQMLDAPSEEVSAFIYWFIWVWYTGSFVALLGSIPTCLGLSVPTVDVVHALLAAVASSLALCFDFFFQNMLETRLRMKNPMRLIVNVLKYAATHKHPVRRSALTYWEEGIPSRIDLGKSKYGGPFTTEQVEDVKTFFRIILVSGALVAFTFPTQMCVASTSTGVLEQHFRGFLVSECSHSLVDTYTSFPVFIVLFIPLHELLIYPLARNWIPTMLKRVGIGAVTTILFAVTAFSVDTAGHIYTNATVPCMFTADSTSPVIDINFLWVGVPLSLLLGFQLMTYNIAVFEFIYAQTPYNAKGLLFGVSLATLNLFLALGSIPLIVWGYGWTHPVTFPSCGFYYFLLAALVALLGLVLLCVVSRWYRTRERDEPQNEQRFVEDYFNRYTQQSPNSYFAHII